MGDGSVVLVLAVCADRVPAAVVIELRDFADRPRYDVRSQTRWIRARDVGAPGIRTANVTSLSGVLDVSHRWRHVSHVNELRVESCGSVIRVDWKIGKIAQNLATSCACGSEVGRENITVLI